MKDCAEIHALLPLYEEEGLSPEGKSRVARHLDQCAQARKELAQLGRLRRALGEMPEPPLPDGLHDKIMARLRSRGKIFTFYRLFWPLSSGFAAAAAILVFFLLRENPTWRDVARVSHIPTLQEAQPFTGVKSVESRYVPTPLVHAALARKKMSAFPPVQGQALSARPSAPVPEGPEMEQENPGKTTRLSLNPPAGGNAGLAALPTANQAPPVQAQAQPMKAEKKRMAEGFSRAPQAAVMPPLSVVSGVSTDNLQKSAYSPEPQAPSWQGDSSPLGTELQKVLSTEEDFEGYWQVLKPDQPLPKVDFTKQCVVLLTAGQEPTSGYSILVSNVESTLDQVVLHYRVAAPPSDAMVTPSPTYPWFMRVMDKPVQTLTFQKDP